MDIFFGIIRRIELNDPINSRNVQTPCRYVCAKENAFIMRMEQESDAQREGKEEERKGGQRMGKRERERGRGERKTLAPHS